MRSWILFVSARHFRTRRREKGHTASVLSVGGIAAGVMTLIAVLAVMNGFQIGTIEDILEVNSYHLQVRLTNVDTASQVAGRPVDAATELAGLDGVDAATELAGLTGVDAAIPFSDMYALAQGFFADAIAIAIRAVPPTVRSQDSGFADKLEIVSGVFDLTLPNSIVVGEELARGIGLRVGDSLSVVNFSADGLNLARPDSTDLVVTGLFKTGFLEYDAGWGFISLDGARNLGGGEAYTVGVKLRDRFSDKLVTRRIREVLPGADIVSWREYNRSIFGALRLEKTLLMLLIGLIFIVVGVNIYQSLRRSVVERTEEIGVLRALGATPASLQFVFVIEGLWIGLSGAVLGTTLGLLISTNINAVFAGAEIVVNGILSAAAWVAGFFAQGPAGTTSGFTIFSPAYFYLESVPAVIVPGEVVGVALFALVSAVLSAIAASRRVSGIIPAEVLRYE